MSDAWYVSKDGEQFGPFPLAELQKRLGEFDLSQLLVWHAGFSDWKRAEDVLEFRLKPPPLPPKGMTQENKFAPLTSRKKEARKVRKLVERVVVIFAWAISFALAKVVGSNFWLPTISITIAWAGLRRLNVNEIVLPMMAILIGHTAWITIGVCILLGLHGANEELLSSLTDPVLVAALAFWVLRRSSVASCITVLLYEVMGMLYMIYQLSGPSTNEVPLAVHLLLRLLGIVAAGYAVWGLRHSASKEASIA